MFKNIDKKNHSKKFKIGLLKTNYGTTQRFYKKRYFRFFKKISKNKNIILEEVDCQKSFIIFIKFIQIFIINPYHIIFRMNLKNQNYYQKQ